MRVIRHIPLSLKTAEVLRRQGLIKGTKVRPEIRLLIRKALASLKRSRLLEPALAYEYRTAWGMTDSRISLEGDKALHGSFIPAISPEAKELAVVLCTTGQRLGKQVTDYSKNGETLQGAVLDGIDSAALDKLVSQILRLIATEVSSRGYEISSPVNPSMPGFPLTKQRNLSGLVNADEIGVRADHFGGTHAPQIDLHGHRLRITDDKVDTG